jgi:[FeFe] hydrogenase (group B1/B3)
MRKFENHVQQVRNEVYEKVAKYTYEVTLDKKRYQIANEINPGPNPRFRCCIHHERAVTEERIQLAMGGDQDIPNKIEVLYNACEQCQDSRYMVTENCRGCIAHRCQQSCPVDAISIVNNKALIDTKKCIECGKCHKACPYNAIADVQRPCVRACPNKAISIDKHKKAIIDDEKCIQCGACVYYCPFGAIQDKSDILNVIQSMQEKDQHVYGVVAPAIATQFETGEIGKIVSAMKKLGFTDVIEAALGADMVVVHEAEEFIERMEQGDTFMTTSCCPAFVKYIELNYPELVKNVSSTVSPMVATARLVKSIDSKAKVVFIGPCIAKKEEADSVNNNIDVDYVLTFEELTGMLYAKEIDFETLPESPLENASFFARNFAGSGGVSKAIEALMKEKNPNQTYEIIVCDGIADCEKTLRLAKAGRIKNALIEGMACQGGCIKGPATMHYGMQDKKNLAMYAQAAKEKSTKDALRVIQLENINMER